MAEKDNYSAKDLLWNLGAGFTVFLMTALFAGWAQHTGDINTLRSSAVELRNDFDYLQRKFNEANETKAARSGAVDEILKAQKDLLSKLETDAKEQIKFAAGALRDELNALDRRVQQEFYQQISEIQKNILDIRTDLERVREKKIEGEVNIGKLQEQVLEVEKQNGAKK